MNDTRSMILQANYQAMRKHGFQGVRPDKVIAELGVTKGALYHYFPSKKDLGYAVVEELISPNYLGLYAHLLESQGNPIDLILDRLHFLLHPANPDDIQLGCPLNNLMLEMSPLDEGFRLRLSRILNGMHRNLAAGLQLGISRGLIQPETDAEAAAWMILSTVEGAFGLAKSLQDPGVMHQTYLQLSQYLDSLRT